jgi:SAM-dependent methyltransferase
MELVWSDGLRQDNDIMKQLARSTPYDNAFEGFDTALMRRYRELSYGEDIGQHSWTSAEELRELCIGIGRHTEVIDLGCGAGGPLTFIAESSGCAGIGIDISEAAVESARKRVEQKGISDRVSFCQADCNETLPLAGHSFDVAISIDVILHLQDRCKFVSQVGRLIKPGGQFIFTDAGVLTGTMTEEERQRRTLFGYTTFVPTRVNEEAITRSGLVIKSVLDSTNRLIKNASGRLRARQILSAELLAIEGPDKFRKQNNYLETILELAERRVLSRYSYTAGTREPTSV